MTKLVKNPGPKDQVFHIGLKNWRRLFMSEDKTIEILKNAILLEKRGKAFYSKVSDQASGQAVKTFFEMMADEEDKHIQILMDQFKYYKQKLEFKGKDYPENYTGDISGKVLTGDLKKEISGAGYEAAAISAAMSMENNAIKLYSQRAAEAQDPNEKALYDWLSRWEAQHLKFLAEIDKELTEQIWYDNSFWPF
jgi:rubrerythrin